MPDGATGHSNSPNCQQARPMQAHSRFRSQCRRVCLTEVTSTDLLAARLRGCYIEGSSPELLDAAAELWRSAVSFLDMAVDSILGALLPFGIMAFISHTTKQARHVQETKVPLTCPHARKAHSIAAQSLPQNAQPFLPCALSRQLRK